MKKYYLLTLLKHLAILCIVIIKVLFETINKIKSYSILYEAQPIIQYNFENSIKQQ